mmetsp:Transcript_29452/g.66686  ORF Transcript_29452/g.66686 Transcript_29452/m.66686 type:complete len:86 (+) Transcript_29452:117-374(+)
MYVVVSASKLEDIDWPFLKMVGTVPKHPFKSCSLHKSIEHFFPNPSRCISCKLIYDGNSFFGCNIKFFSSICFDPVLEWVFLKIC